MIDDVDIDNRMISNKVYFDKKCYKYLIGYKYDENKIKAYTHIHKVYVSKNELISKTLW